MLFDAFGRLAFGQVSQDSSTSTTNLVGASATGAAGTQGKEVGATIIGVGAIASAGIEAPSVIIVIPLGVSAVGSAGIISVADPKLLSGVSGTGSAGSLATTIQVGVTGAATTTTIGALVTTNTTPQIVGVSTTTGVGTLQGAESAGGIGGVSTTTAAGTIIPLFSGGGSSADADPPVKRKPRMGMEPVKKLPPQPVVAAPKRSIPLPPPMFGRAAPPALTFAETPPSMVSPDLIPDNLLEIRDQIQAAQDETDIRSVLAYLDSLD